MNITDTFKSMLTRLSPAIEITTDTFRDLADFLFPRRCHLCGASLPANLKYVCPICLSKLPRTHYHRIAMNPMEQRFAGLFPFEKASGHFFYSSKSELSKLVVDFKYHQFPGLARYLGIIMGKELYSTPFLSDIDIIIPVPMHFLKYGRRGYNQAEELAKGISDSTKIPVFKNLVAIKGHKTQTKKTHQQRAANILGIFKVRKPEDLTGKHILLLDDICTTGSTLREAAKTLHASAPGIRITLLTLGVTF